MTVHCSTETIVFEDGSKLVVAEENWLTGVTLLRLQKAAVDTVDQYIGLERQYFHVTTYPKLVASIVQGTPPTEEEAIMMPSRELEKWYKAVRSLNPQWFPEDKEETPPAEAEKKRKPRKRK